LKCAVQPLHRKTTSELAGRANFHQQSWPASQWLHRINKTKTKPDGQLEARQAARLTGWRANRRARDWDWDWDWELKKEEEEEGEAAAAAAAAKEEMLARDSSRCSTYSRAPSMRNNYPH